MDYSKRPDLTKAPAYAKHYFAQTEQYHDLMEALERNGNALITMVEDLSEEQLAFRYAEDKWDIRTLIVHILDAERVFQYRALRFSRFDATPVSGFNEDDYAAASAKMKLSHEELLDDIHAVRMATFRLFHSMTDEMADFEGTANNMPNTARNLGWLIVGHCEHHLAILRDRYFVNF